MRTMRICCSRACLRVHPLVSAAPPKPTTQLHGLGDLHRSPINAPKKMQYARALGAHQQQIASPPCLARATQLPGKSEVLA